MANKSSSLSLKLKLILGWMYIYFLGYLLTPVIVLPALTKAGSSTPIADSVFVIITSIIMMVASGLTIYFLHKRKQLSITLVLLTMLLSYGLSTIPLGRYDMDAPMIEVVTVSAVILVIDFVVAAYMLMSPAVKSQLNKK